jgi:tRNA U34 2-thiouridine synthase MnmA/TrmU
MMRKAREIMEREGADFIFTGEVLGQRPKSQRRDTLRIIERDSGLDGRLLRPLSAKLLPPTIAESEGLIDRAQLEDISGRSRSRQMALAKELGVVDWPQPAGGCCYLTDESFARKFFDVLDAREESGEARRMEPNDVVLLSTGRHFRLSPRAKLVVGRNEVENAILDRYGSGRARLAAAEPVLGPVALVEGEPTWEERMLACAILARYGKAKEQTSVSVEWSEDGVLERYEVTPFADEARLEQMRV